MALGGVGMGQQPTNLQGRVALIGLNFLSSWLDDQNYSLEVCLSGSAAVSTFPCGNVQ